MKRVKFFGMFFLQILTFGVLSQLFSLFLPIRIMDAKATLNPSWVVPGDAVTASDVEKFRNYVAWWLDQSLIHGNSSGDWRPMLFYNNRTLKWSAEDLEYSGWFYDFYVAEAYRSTGDPKYPLWLKGFADAHLYDNDMLYCDTHECSSQISALIAAYDLCYGRNNPTLANRIQQLIDRLISERYNPKNGLWRVSKRVTDEYVWKMFYVLRAIAQWYMITGDPALRNVMEKGLNFAVTHQDVYGGKQWYPFLDWNTGQKLGSGDFAEYHETQQGLDGLLYAGMVLNDESFKACFKKYLEWWCDKGIDDDGGIYGWYDKNQKGLYNTYNGLVGELIYFLVQGYLWIGNSTYITYACKLFHKMTKWMTYTPEPSAYGYNCSYVLHYDLQTDNPSAITVESDYGRQVDGFCAAVAYNGFNYLLKVLPGYTQPKLYKLQVNSSPPISNVIFTLNGTTKMTPYSAMLSQANWTIAMPSSVISDGVTYSFSNWTDENTNPVRTINLTTDTTLTANYEPLPPPPPPPPPPTHVLEVNSIPVTGISFKLDEASYITNYSATIYEGSHTLIMPSTVTIGETTYKFVKWEDGSTNTIRTLTVTSDMSVTANFEAAPAPPPGMHIFFSSGFEGGNYNEWDISRAKTGASIGIVSDITHHGSYSSKVTVPDGGYAFTRKNLPSGQIVLSTRFYVYFTNLPTSAGSRCCLLKYSDVNYADIIWLMLYHDGNNVLLRIQRFYPQGTDDYVWNPSINTWYCLELTFVKDINGSARVYVNGAEVITWLGDSSTAGTPLRVEIGAQEMNGYTQTLYTDCIVIADGYIGHED